MMRAARKIDVQVRAGGGALLLLAAGLVVVTAALRAHDAVQPTMVEFCIAFVAVCSASIGAAMLIEGHSLFEEAKGPRARPAPEAAREPRNRR